ncbi:mate-domain-containing protein, partial [Flammula alnicola]
MAFLPSSSSESTPLLSDAYQNDHEPTLVEQSSSPPSTAEGDFPQPEGAAQHVGAVKLDFKLFKSLFWDSVPVILSYILQNSIQTASIVIVGRLGPNELSVAAFSLMLAFVTGWIVALGGTTALDTLGSQAYTGGSHKTDLSIHFQRCVIILWILLIPVAFLWAYIEPALLAFGQPVHLARDVQEFLRILILGAPGYVGFESLKKYLQCQGIMGASTLILIIISPINIFLNIFFVHYTPLGCYEFLKLALPGILMVGTEWAAFEIVALAAGRLGEVPLAAQSIIMTTDQILNTLPFGIGVAASTRVGNLIGSRSPSGAKVAAHASALLSVIVGTIVMAAMIASKDVYGLLFSSDKDVVLLVSKVMPLVASFQVADGLADRRQHLGALFNILAYYILALPMGLTLAFHSKTRLGLQGLWIGEIILEIFRSSCGLFIVGIGEYGVVWLGTDWDKEIKKGMKEIARKRN